MATCNLSLFVKKKNTKFEIENTVTQIHLFYFVSEMENRRCAESPVSHIHILLI